MVDPDRKTTLVLATSNPGKIRELRQLFGSSPFELVGLREFGITEEVEETGLTFRDNAELKARYYGARSGTLSLADDSGLEVDALGGQPGVHSARFGGQETGYDIKITKLLSMLDKSGEPSRRARFVCVMAIADGEGRVLQTVDGVCEGTIAFEPRGTNGFGYDPIFVPDGFDRTFGELAEDVKQNLSHRARASALALRYLLDFYGGLT